VRYRVCQVLQTVSGQRWVIRYRMAIARCPFITQLLT
jgi:hypothetical protein